MTHFSLGAQDDTEEQISKGAPRPRTLAGSHHCCDTVHDKPVLFECIRMVWPSAVPRTKGDIDLINRVRAAEEQGEGLALHRGAPILMWSLIKVVLKGFCDSK